jgi:hypothetical protein
VQTIWAGADFLVRSTGEVKEGAATSFVARVGDPALYIDRGIDVGQSRNDRIWATPNVAVGKEMQKSKGRSAVVLDAKIFGKLLPVNASLASKQTFVESDP